MTSHTASSSHRPSSTSSEERVEVPRNIDLVELLGENDRYLEAIADAFSDVALDVEDNIVICRGGAAKSAQRVLTELLALVLEGEHLSTHSVRRVIGRVHSSGESRDVLRFGRGKTVRASTAGQKAYVEAIKDATITFALGPAGTGKSFLAVAAACEALSRHSVQRIVLTRPAVEAGEHLGFLPGDLSAKVDPYLRPLFDAMIDILGTEAVSRHIEKGTIEVAPLAFMRGRTLHDAFVILDEAQNTTPAQLKMFLTRLGLRSKAVITGDVTQIDLGGSPSGLVGAEELLGNIEGIAFCHLNGSDVVRHRIVADIVAAYEVHESLRATAKR